MFKLLFCAFRRWYRTCACLPTDRIWNFPCLGTWYRLGSGSWAALRSLAALGIFYWYRDIAFLWLREILWVSSLFQHHVPCFNDVTWLQPKAVGLHSDYTHSIVISEMSVQNSTVSTKGGVIFMCRSAELYLKIMTPLIEILCSCDPIYQHKSIRSALGAAIAVDYAGTSRWIMSSCGRASNVGTRKRLIKRYDKRCDGKRDDWWKE